LTDLCKFCTVLTTDAWLVQESGVAWHFSVFIKLTG